MIDPLSRWLHDRETPHGPVILMYHSVRRNRHPDWPYAVRAEDFRAQLDFLRLAGYATPTVSELLAAPTRFAGRTAVITFDDGYADNLAAWELLAERNMRATWYMTAGYIGATPPWNDPDQPRERLLTGDELRQMAASGMEIGSHSVTHPTLPDLADPMLTHELVQSKSTLEDLLGMPVTSFAYPFGRWDERCEQAVKMAGYASACLTRTGWGLRDGNPYRLRRITIYNTDTASSFVRKLAWASHDVAWPRVASRMLSRLVPHA